MSLNQLNRTDPEKKYLNPVVYDLLVQHDLTVAGSFSISGNLNVGGNLSVTGNATVGGDLKVTGASTFTGLTTHNGGLTSTQVTTGDLATDGTIVINPFSGSPINIGNSAGTMVLAGTIAAQPNTELGTNGSPFSGLLLNNANQVGAVVTKLDYYEEATITNNVIGPWAAPQSCDYTLCRIGKNVTMNVPGVAAASGVVGQLIDFTAVVPARFRPANPGFVGLILANDDAALNAQTPATVAVGNVTGSIVIFNATNTDPASTFAGLGVNTTGFNSFSLTWSVP